MGYETKLYMCECSGNHLNEAQEYASVVCMIDLCKVGEGMFSRLRDSQEKAQKSKALHYFYADDGNTKILEDMYGSPVVSLDPGDVLEALKADNEDDPYRRFDIAIAALEKFTQHFEKSGPFYPVVLTFGH